MTLYVQRIRRAPAGAIPWRGEGVSITRDAGGRVCWAVRPAAPWNRMWAVSSSAQLDPSIMIIMIIT